MITCSTPKQNVGKLVEGSMPVLHYEIENKGIRQYKIEPWSSCGCSTPIIPKDTIDPGERLTMKLEFDTIGKVGLNEKRFGLKYDDNRLILTFVAEVIKQREKK